MRIRLNGELHDLDGPLTVEALLARLGVDHRRVAVERNLIVVRRAEYGTTPVGDGDEIEVVNFVGGGCSPMAGSRASARRADSLEPARGAKSPSASERGWGPASAKQ